MQSINDVEESWIEFLGSESVRFPRDMGKYRPSEDDFLVGDYPRQKVYDEDGYLNFLSNSRFEGAVAATLSDPYIEQGIVSRLKAEIGDNSYIHVAHYQAKLLSKGLTELYGISQAWIFTGHRSFHLHIPIRPYQLKTKEYNVPLIVFNDIIKRIQREYNVNFDIDWKVVKDFKRMLRVPYSLYVKLIVKRVKRYSIPVCPYKQKLLDILRYSELCESPVEFILEDGQNHVVRQMIKDTDAILYEQEKEIGRLRSDYTPRRLNGEYRRLISFLLENAPFIRDGRHRILYHLLVPALRCSGYSLENALRLCEKFIETSGKPFGLYKPLVEYWFFRVSEEGAPYKPMRISTFLADYPELKQYFRRRSDRYGWV